MMDLETYRGRKILVAMSGGVDSAMTAVALKRAGAEVIGVHMRVWHYEDCGDDLNEKVGTCCSPADAADARRVAEQFDFPFYSIDFQTDFRRSVIEPFAREYLAGRTPNPCVHCNSRVKLGTLLAKAKAWGAEAVATGHYARLARGAGGRMQLMRARDREKDQSYYLFDLGQAQLESFRMPLGDATKDEVRELARELDVHIAEKPDSQDICFVTHGDYRRFLREEMNLSQEELAGAIVDTEGKALGRHGGVHEFTIGQRRGIGVSAPHPLYVVDLIPETRTVVVGPESEIYADGLEARGWQWVSREAPAEPIAALAQIRYRSEATPATLTPLGETGRARIEFETPQKAVTPGQAVVCYDAEDGETVISGGWVEKRLDGASARVRN